MKILSTATVAVVLASSLLSQAESEVPYGIEALTSYRSEYNYRGFTLANDTLDFQLSTQISLNESTSINISSWYGEGTSDDNFSEFGFFADIRKDINQFTYALSATYRDYSNSIFDDGIDITASATWHINDCWDFESLISYDTGVEGFYGELNASYYYRIDDSSYFTIKGGVSAVSDYYERDGFNDIFTKISYTYNINETVSVSPYIGTSILLDNEDNNGDSFYGGIYFAVSF